MLRGAGVAISIHHRQYVRHSRKSHGVIADLRRGGVFVSETSLSTGTGSGKYEEQELLQALAPSACSQALAPRLSFDDKVAPS